MAPWMGIAVAALQWRGFASGKGGRHHKVSRGTRRRGRIGRGRVGGRTWQSQVVAEVIPPMSSPSNPAVVSPLVDLASPVELLLQSISLEWLDKIADKQLSEFR
jgi:hypothetical protein